MPYAGTPTWFREAKANEVLWAMNQDLTGYNPKSGPWNLRNTQGFVHHDFVEGREFGGPVNGNQTYLVGENGPELFRSKTGGEIISDISTDGELKGLVRELISAVKESDTEVNVYTDLEGQVEAQVEDFRAEIKERLNREQKVFV